MKNAINWNTDESPARVTPYLVFPSSLEFSYSVYSSPKYFEQKKIKSRQILPKLPKCNNYMFILVLN